jgi:hypothetical protein
VVGKCAHEGDGGSFLSSAEGGGGDEETGVFAEETTGLPLVAGLVPEGLFMLDGGVKGGGEGGLW